MASREFLPRTEAGLLIWLQIFANKLSTYAATLGVAPAQVTQFQNDLTNATTALDKVQAAKTGLQSLVQTKDTALDAVTKRIRDTAVILKRHAAYTNAIGEDLGIVPAAPTHLAPEAKPQFTVTAFADKVRLDWVKGESDGVVVQCKRGNESGFTTLGRDTVSPYDDMRPNATPDTPETRTYRMRYLAVDEEVGDWSDEAKVIAMI